MNPETIVISRFLINGIEFNPFGEDTEIKRIGDENQKKYENINKPRSITLDATFTHESAKLLRKLLKKPRLPRKLKKKIKDMGFKIKGNTIY